MAVDFTAPTKKEPLNLWPGDDAWGPFEFDISPALPEGVTITDVSGEAYFEDSPMPLIEPETLQTIDDTTLQVKFQVPTDFEAGQYYLRLKLTLSNDAIKYLRFGPITVLEWGE